VFNFLSTWSQGSSEAFELSTYAVFLPETVLVITALASAVLGFAWRKRPEALWTSPSWHRFRDLRDHGPGRPRGHETRSTGRLALADRNGREFQRGAEDEVDGFALFFQLMFAFVAFLVILVSRVHPPGGAAPGGTTPSCSWPSSG